MTENLKELGAESLHGWKYAPEEVLAKLIKDTTGAAGRADKGKLRYDLIPPHVIEQLAAVLTGGAVKYGPNNWRADGGMAWTRCYASMMRHIQAWYQGEDTDPESGLSHLAHAMCNITFLMEYERTNTERDDRPFKASND